jgi:lysophospholipase L1-like esterase
VERRKPEQGQRHDGAQKPCSRRLRRHRGLVLPNGREGVWEIGRWHCLTRPWYHPLVDRRWILGGLLIGAGIGVVRAVTMHPKIHKDTRLLLIGDSLAKGLSPQFKALATEEGIPYLGAGVVGSRVDQWVHSRWLTEDAAAIDPTLVLVSLGTNDCYSQLTPEAVAASQEELFTLLPPDADVVWIGVPALPSTYNGHHPNVDILAALEEQAKYYFPSHELDIPRGPDGLHPNATGYAGWAGAIWDWLS